tara:strand:+ start:428 stop:838 length:411 start_codon:yes stop_codon:yes gene_type:complete
MPVYVYRCLDCGLSFDVRHSFDETYDDSCGGCQGVVRKHMGHVHVSASATPTRGTHDGKAINWEETKVKERQKDEDMAAYKRLRREGIQPKSIDGSAHSERHAGTKWEVQAGVTLKGPLKERKRKERALNDVLGST